MAVDLGLDDCRFRCRLLGWPDGSRLGGAEIRRHGRRSGDLTGPWSETAAGLWSDRRGAPRGAEKSIKTTRISSADSDRYDKMPKQSESLQCPTKAGAIRPSPDRRQALCRSRGAAGRPFTRQPQASRASSAASTRFRTATLCSSALMYCLPLLPPRPLPPPHPASARPPAVQPEVATRRWWGRAGRTRAEDATPGASRGNRTVTTAWR